MAGLSYSDTVEILARLAELGDELVLVGGQAVNFWAEHYAPRVPELAELAPYTSEDIDFQGSRQTAERAADLLAGRARIADPFDPITAGTVAFEDRLGQTRGIDILRALHGMDAEDVKSTSIQVDILVDGGPSFRVIQPVRCMESRVKNVMSLPGYQTSHAIEQMKASVLCAGEYMRDLLAEGQVRPVLTLAKRIYSFCHDHPDGRRVATAYGVDPFSSVPLDSPMPSEFRERGHPQMLSRLAERRRRDAEPASGYSSGLVMHAPSRPGPR